MKDPLLILEFSLLILRALSSLLSSLYYFSSDRDDDGTESIQSKV